jgi:hypothetical protein
MATRLATVAEVREVAPELGEVGDPDPPVTDATITTWARIAGRMIGLERWGDDASDGHALLTAHMVTLSPVVSGDDGSGQLASAAVGPVSASFAKDAPTSDDLLQLTSTGHGRAYLALRQIAASTGTAILSNTLVRQG